MNILHMISKNDRYGAQRIFLDQAASLTALGHRLTIVVRGNEGYVTDSLRTMGAAFHGIPMRGPADLLYLRRLVKNDGIDVIHTALDRADHFGIVLARLTGRPIVSTMMVPRCHPGYRFMDRVIALSEKQAALLRGRGVGPGNISVLRPGIDVKRFAAPRDDRRGAWREKLRADAYDIIFCHVGSLLARKAHPVSLEIVKECHDRGAKPLLVIAGDPLEGDYYEGLRRRIKRFGLEDNVRFAGWTADVPELLSLSHFTMLPSEHEALGVVLMEGMAAGTPIVARAGEGGAALVEEYGAGFLYEPERGAGALAGDIISLKKDARRFRELSERCRQVAGREFSLDRFGKRLEGLLANSHRQEREAPDDGRPGRGRY